MKLALLLLMLAGCASTPREYRGLRVRPDVLHALADIQDEFERETAWCLLGKVYDDTVDVQGLGPAVVTDRTPESATFDCAGWKAIGVAHNHPNSPGATCTPSTIDLATLDRMHLRYHIMLVSCNGGVFAYAFRGEPTVYRLSPEFYGR